MSAILALDPSRFRDYFDLATLQVFVGDLDGYRSTCCEMLDRFGASAKESPYLSERLSKTCLLAPGAVGDLGPVVALAARSVDGTENNGAFAWFLVARALAHYREGQFGETQARLTTFFTLAGEGRNHLTAMAHALQSLSEQQLGNSDAARQSLQKARASISDGLPSPDRGTFFPADWSDWLRCLIMLREAEVLIEKRHP